MEAVFVGVAIALLCALILWVIRKLTAKISAAREREARHSQGDRYYHWMPECKAYPDDTFATPGMGGREPCNMCNILVAMSYAPGSEFRLSFFVRKFKKRFPKPEK